MDLYRNRAINAATAKTKYVNGMAHCIICMGAIQNVPRLAASPSGLVMVTFR
ncbi:hypothetical protein TBK1r_78410 [Stieleria magnilauensis]|uniref:Uncharacterized protein n=1 Tax=Stieleria magnilauensis TaxID=2527963 RepID=A0ABX5Y5L2_9BACT|nr:hypothetical protein TBK1r_78410 [Planctomycetes bacterium TBK1r]